MRQKKSLKYVAIAVLLLIAVVIVGLINSKKEEWTLMVCEEMLNSSDCKSNAYRVPHLSTLNDCITQGLDARFKLKYPGYECGRNCKNDEYSDALICDFVCNNSNNGCPELVSK